MKSEDNNLSGIIGKGKFTIPIFQRSYVWEKENWKRLLDDIDYIYKYKLKSHYMGSLMLKDINKDNNERQIIDGQQRLTTLMILLKVIELKISKDYQGVINEINRVLHIKNSRGEIQSSRIHHSHYDKVAFDIIHNLSKEDNLENVYIDSEKYNKKIISCFKYFYDINFNNNKLEKYYDIIFDNLLFVQITIEEDDDEQRIFDTMNSLGVRLSSVDIIKNYLFNLVDDYSFNLELYSNYWEDIFLNKSDSGDSMNYWNNILEIGKQKRTYLEQLFYAVAFIEGYKEKNSDQSFLSFNNMANVYKDYFSSKVKNDKKLLKGFFEKLKSYAFLTREFFNLESIKSLSFKDSKRKLYELILDPGHPIYPILLFFLYELKGKDDTLNKCLNFLSSYSFRRMICSNNKNLPTMFHGFIKEIKTNQAKSNKVNLHDEFKNRVKKYSNLEDYKYFTDAELKNSINNRLGKNLKLRKQILYLIELYLREANGRLEYDDYWSFDKVQIEHVMPKNTNNINWQDNELKDMPEEDQISLINNIGNLLLIDKALNNKLKNSHWSKSDDKMKSKRSILNNYIEDYSKKRGKKRPYELVYQALKNQNWNKDVINERSDYIINLLCKEIYRYYNL